MPTTCTFSFNIAAWHAVSNRLATPEQWREWAAGRLNAQTLPEHKPALAFLPAMQRRRLGAAARLVCGLEFGGAVFRLPDGLRLARRRD